MPLPDTTGFSGSLVSRFSSSMAFWSGLSNASTTTSHAGEQPLHVGRNDPLGVGLVGEIGIDGLKLLDKRERFRDAEVFHRVMLSVEVGDVHHIEIHEDEMTDTQPRQKDRKVGAKPAQTRNADTRLVQLGLNIRAVAFHQCVMQLFFG